MPDLGEKYQYGQLAGMVLRHPLDFKWSLQGFGMLRFYVTQDIRVHVWDSRYRIKDVSGIHSHPWHFRSTVLCGRIKQHRYIRDMGFLDDGFDTYKEYTVKAGEGGGLVGQSRSIKLKRGPLEVVNPGESYKQRADEVHLSTPEDGTVTIVLRELADPDDPDHPFVYIPVGRNWVSAEPRQATTDEVLDICNYALEKWFYAGV